MSDKVSPLVQNGRYQITATDTDVYLSVWSPVNGGLPVTKAAIIQDLTSQKFEFESEFISTVIREAMGQPIRIFNSRPSKAGRYQVTATDTGVFLSVWPPINTGLPVKKAEIIQELISRNFIEFESDFIAIVIREAIGQPVQIMNSLPSEDGRYQITATDAGVHLTVWPPVNAGSPVKKADIIKDLTQQDLSSFVSDFISVVIKEAVGQPILIINSMQSLPLEPHIRVRVRRDRMEARLDITTPEDVPTVTMPQLIEKLNSAGVIYGVDVQVLESLMQIRSGSDILFAQGNPPCDGANAFLKYYVDSDSQGRPVEMDDGRVDFKENNSFLCVEEGQLLVEKIPATLGTPGIDVFGLPIPAKPGKDMLMPVGKNVINVDDWRLYAAIDGHLHIFLDKRINVIPVIIIAGDVDYSTGNIEFRGSVIVRGSVQPDFSVKAGGNVEVCGSICGGMVEANNIIIHRGIQGMSRSVIKARERLVANFIENAIVYADQEIIISDVILNSSVFAGIRIIVEGRRGLIRGGRISAGEEVRAFTIGNQANVATDIEVSVKPFLKDELINLRLERKKAETLCEELKHSLSYVLSKGIDNLTADKRERYKRKETEYNTLVDRVEEMWQRIISIENLLHSLKPGKICVYGIVYPGVKISIGTLIKPLNDSLQYISFYAQGGEIKFTSLR